jgi:FtsZ-binding cell division protein ZapB
MAKKTSVDEKLRKLSGEISDTNDAIYNICYEIEELYNHNESLSSENLNLQKENNKLLRKIESLEKKLSKK